MQIAEGLAEIVQADGVAGSADKAFLPAQGALLALLCLHEMWTSQNLDWLNHMFLAQGKWLELTSTR